MAEDTLRQTGIEQESTLALAGQALEQARKLVRHELESTAEELRHEFKRLLGGSALLVTSAWVKLAALGAFSMAFYLHSQERPAKGPLLTGLGLIGASTALALGGLRVLPRHPFAAPVSRVLETVRALHEKLLTLLKERTAIDGSTATHVFAHTMLGVVLGMLDWQSTHRRYREGACWLKELLQPR
jgi:hypothetical protein